MLWQSSVQMQNWWCQPLACKLIIRLLCIQVNVWFHHWPPAHHWQSSFWQLPSSVNLQLYRQGKWCKPDIWCSTFCNNTFLIGWRNFNASCTSNNFWLFTSTCCSRIEHLNNELKWNAAERYSICCRGKVLNLQGYSIQASGFIGCVLKVALSKENEYEYHNAENSTNHGGS